jgi:serine/threonine protein kinase
LKIIHRDLTNANIMLTKNNIVKIMDFGLARIVEHLMSEQSIIGGTPSYMAPEQVQGAPIDQRADIYALGVNLFELTTGRLPFVQGDLGYHHVHSAPPDPRDFNPKIPADLSEVTLKCLAKNPADRYQSVAELMEALRI